MTEPQARPRELDLLRVALDVHMTAMGSYERSYATGAAEQLNDVALLLTRLANWKPSSAGRSSDFDEAVRNLLRVAVKEAFHGAS